MTLLIDLSHTSHTRARTGIQRVCRALHAELTARESLLPLCFDRYRHGWRELDTRERANLADSSGCAPSRGARWSFSQRLFGRARWLLGGPPATPVGDALIVPELFSTEVGRHLPALFTQVRGPRVAIFHDAIGLKFPELTPPETVARLPLYLRELSRFDGVAAVSHDSAESLREFWRWAQVGPIPPVTCIPLGLEPATVSPQPKGTSPTVLCVSTIEARKNHPALLDAAEALWREGLDFRLELVGLARPDTGSAALERIRRLTADRRPLVHHGPVTEAELRAAYARCLFTVYPSVYEGFGLPVLESLRHGRPCLCSSGGALAETAAGGGVKLLAETDAPALAAALRDLLLDQGKVEALAAAARERRFRSWSEYAADLRTWMDGLRRRD